MQYNQQDELNVSYNTWLAALGSSACIGFTSLVPWLFNITFFENRKRQGTEKDGRLKLLLSFAVGAMLGDIFFHLVPESFQTHMVEVADQSGNGAHQKVGLSIIAGLFMFIIVEMALDKWANSNEKREKIILTNEVTEKVVKKNADLNFHENSAFTIVENNNTLMADLNDNYEENHEISSEDYGRDFRMRCNIIRESDKLPSETGRSKMTEKLNNPTSKPETEVEAIEAGGYLNLIANGFDNFTHGLAIGASFLVSSKMGLLTTFVIFIHEIPHEICDYAILVNSGFSRWGAVKAQSSVSLFGLLGTAIALYVKSVETLRAKTLWILPFSAGGFLYIALVNLLPEVLDRESDVQNSMRQVSCVILGIIFMAILAFV